MSLKHMYLCKAAIGQPQIDLNKIASTYCWYNKVWNKVASLFNK